MIWGVEVLHMYIMHYVMLSMLVDKINTLKRIVRKNRQETSWCSNTVSKNQVLQILYQVLIVKWYT